MGKVIRYTKIAKGIGANMANKTTILKACRDAAYAKKGESGQRNAVQMALARYGYAKLPRIQNFTDERRTVRAYAWFDAPTGGDLLLITGPSIEPTVRNAAADEYVSVTDAGVFVPAQDAMGKMVADANAAMSRAMGRVVGRQAEKAPPVKRKPAKRKPAKPARAAWQGTPSPWNDTHGLPPTPTRRRAESTGGSYQRPTLGRNLGTFQLAQEGDGDATRVVQQWAAALVPGVRIQESTDVVAHKLHDSSAQWRTYVQSLHDEGRTSARRLPGAKQAREAERGAVAAMLEDANQHGALRALGWEPTEYPEGWEYDEDLDAWARKNLTHPADLTALDAAFATAAQERITKDAANDARDRDTARARARAREAERAPPPASTSGASDMDEFAALLRHALSGMQQ